MTIYLYVKTHRKTGLKYLGQTQQDPAKYRGSGIRWVNHIRVHGNDVDTVILKECQTKEELKEWGAYYSELWDIVDSNEWANLMIEKGDGVSSEQAKKQFENGTHPFLGGEIQRKTNKKQIENGTHPWLGPATNKKRVENGTHPFLSGDIQRKTNKIRLENGTHPFLDSEFQREIQITRLENGTHHFLDSEFQSYVNKKRVENGTHPSQVKWTCEHCGKSGNGITNYKRWHGLNCKSLREKFN